MASGLLTVAAAFGGLTFIYYVYQIFSFVHFQFLYRSKLNKYLPKDPKAGRPWALITGASDGIGKGFAHELLASGFNIIIHGRNPDKLSSVKSSLAPQFPNAEIRIAVLNAHPFTHAELDSFVASLPSPITVLINNVGGIPPGCNFKTFSSTSAEHIDAWIGINAGFPVQLTRALMPKFVDSPLIINLSSACGKIASAYLAMYSGTKAFNAMWSKSLAEELRGEGREAEVLSLTVAEVENQMDRNPGGFGKCGARTFARATLNKVGSGRDEFVPYWQHGVALGAFGLVPDSVAAGWMTAGIKSKRELTAKEE